MGFSSGSTERETEEIAALFPGTDCGLLQRHLGFLEAARFHAQLRAEFESRLSGELQLLTACLRQSEATDDPSTCVQELRQGLGLLIEVTQELLSSLPEGEGDFASCEEMILDAQALFENAYSVAGLDGIEGFECL